MKLIKLLFLIFTLSLFFEISSTHAAPPVTTITPTPNTCTSDGDCTINPNLVGCIVFPHNKVVCNPSPAPKTNPQGTCGEGEINTAFGCISTNVKSGGFINSLLQLAIGLGGVIALLLILGGVFIITTSAGIPDKLNQGKELITSAISGLLFIILSVVLLNLIGIKILSIPGF